MRHKRFLYPWYLSPWIIFFSIARTVAALWILVSPVWGLVWSVAFDILDGQVLLRYVHLDKLRYDLWDKVFDSITLFAELAVVLSTPWAPVMFGLFVYRMVGHVVFWMSQNVRLLIVFPNFFEATFLWLLIPSPWYAPIGPFAMLYTLYGAKMVQEAMLHWLWFVYLAQPWKRGVRGLVRRSPGLVRFLSPNYPQGYK